MEGPFCNPGPFCKTLSGEVGILIKDYYYLLFMRELWGRGEGEWESEDTHGVQVGVKNRERVYAGRN